MCNSNSCLVKISEENLGHSGIWGEELLKYEHAHDTGSIWDVDLEYSDKTYDLHKYYSIPWQW